MSDDQALFRPLPESQGMAGRNYQYKNLIKNSFRKVGWTLNLINVMNIITLHSVSESFYRNKIFKHFDHKVLLRSAKKTKIFKKMITIYPKFLSGKIFLLPEIQSVETCQENTVAVFAHMNKLLFVSLEILLALKHSISKRARYGAQGQITRKMLQRTHLLI